MNDKKDLIKIEHQIKKLKETEAESYDISARELALCSQEIARDLLSFAYALEMKVIPLSLIKLSKTRESLTIAVTENIQYEELQKIRFNVDKEIHLVRVREEVIVDALLIAYKGSNDFLRNAIPSSSPILETFDNKNKSKKSVDKNGGIPNALKAIIEHAYARKASDVHLKPKETEAQILFRVDGKIVISDTPLLDHRVFLSLVNRIKVLSDCDISNKHKSQDGSFVFSLEDRSFTVRVSIVPTLYGEQVVMRLPSVGKVYDFRDLEIPLFTRKALFQALEVKEGGIIFCGPTGSGKTTNLYSLAKEISDSGSHIITIEDPVEQVLPFASQVQVDTSKGQSYSSCLKSILRQDPDVMLIGEIRDKESAAVTLQAILTGHLVLSTVHARSVLEIFLRFRHFGLSVHDLAQSMSVMSSCRLLPKLCSRCKVVDLVATRQLHFSVHKAAGCSLCSYTGYIGRVPIAETLILDSDIKQCLVAGTSLDTCFHKGNYQSFSSSALEQLRKGILGWEEVETYFSDDS